MNADPAAQLRLLDLQAADSAIAQLSHRRRTLPELAAIEQAEIHAYALDGEALEVGGRLEDVAADQRRFESEVDAVRTRKARDDARLLAGGLPSKELEGLQHEVTSLIRRQSSLEDELLEVMERREVLEAEAADVARRRAELDAGREAAEATRDARYAEIDEALTGRRNEHAVIAAELPPDLVALYDKVSAQIGAIGAAALRMRRCEGCRIELSGSELSAARSAAPDTVLRCDNCRRILVRTADSGL